MTYTGVVKEGKIELAEGVKLPEGASVTVQVVGKSDWMKEWDELAEQITQAWQSPKTALEILDECRR